ncbi:MAG: tRNA (cytidine(34)-2'-O)-methyltransferase [Sulfurovaceae bacterium]|nr:tRNA (cytidine(34)-2'-O)-methyltransferase [Sulfurovaceae bacterium]
MFNIVLIHPQIPPNTGTIGRLCVNMGATLHLVKPLGFSIDDKEVKRAGLDYWHKLDLKVWESLEEFLMAHPIDEHFHLATTKTDKLYFESTYKNGDFLLFGSEVSGIPSDILEANKDQCITIPMTKDGRSLNLALSVGIISYEALRQNYNIFKEINK